MKAAVKRFLIILASTVLESLSVTKEQLVRHQQQRAALRRVHQCEINLDIARIHDPSSVLAATQQLQDERAAFNQLLNPTPQ